MAKQKNHSLNSFYILSKDSQILSCKPMDSLEWEGNSDLCYSANRLFVTGNEFNQSYSL